MSSYDLHFCCSLVNDINNTGQQEEQQEFLNSLEIVILSIVLSIIIIMTVFGNLLVMVALCTDRHLRWACWICAGRTETYNLVVSSCCYFLEKKVQIKLFLQLSFEKHIFFTHLSETVGGYYLQLKTILQLHIKCLMKSSRGQWDQISFFKVKMKELPENILELNKDIRKNLDRLLLFSKTYITDKHINISLLVNWSKKLHICFCPHLSGEEL